MSTHGAGEVLNRRRMFRMMRLLRCFCLFAMLSSVVPARAWGPKGHRIVNGRAVDTLKTVAPDLHLFYASHRDYLADHSIDPDLWRRNDKSEGPRHYINLDLFGSEAPFRALPHDREKAEALFGKAFITRGGLVPWTIGHRYRQLVLAWRKRDVDEVLKQSATLGHYVADVHVPFHATANYDGQLTGQKGIHGRFESEMVDRSVDETALQLQNARLMKDPVEAAFGWAVDSIKLCPAVLQADADAAKIDALYGASYYELFTPRARPIAMRRLEEATTDLGSLFLSAWQEAGKPKLGAYSKAGKSRGHLFSCGGHSFS